MTTNQIIATPSEIVRGTIDNALKSYVYEEGIKGCSPAICEYPLGLEPEYKLFSLNNFLTNMPEDRNYIPHRYERDLKKMSFIRLWSSKEDDFEWKAFEDVLKGFSTIQNPISFEILGNREKVYCQLVLEQKDVSLAANVITSRFPGTQFDNFNDSNEDILINTLKESKRIVLNDYYPTPPYWHNLTCFEEFSGSPLDIIYVALNELKKDEIGIFQVLFIPTKKEHDWHRNINILIDLEFKAKYENTSAMHRAFFFQLPSNYLPEISKQEIQKSHPDKPFFAAALRIAVFGSDKERLNSTINSLNTFIGNFRYGANPINILRKDDYKRAMINDKEILSMFTKRISYRHGMIINSAELTGLVHFPSKKILENNNYKICRADKFEVPKNLSEPDGEGSIAIGISASVGKESYVYLPQTARELHMVLIGKTGRGKSTTLENMVWQDIMAEE